MRIAAIFRFTPALALSVLTLPALAQDQTGEFFPEDMGGVMFNTSFSINAPMTAVDAAGKTAEEDAYRASLYTRSAAECELLLASVAATCVVTSVNVSTQISATPGQPDYLYASSNVTMTVELK
ncbi:MAG: hypothetical protein B7Z10_06840 [Rhodobacterales bacterium 32-66-7]|nr:MAG: hypothetical protein B7Z31_12870 [Rhodobacterales bacterium 12-65-15]OYX25280.1 MAG: hypothetical protein B7Z10_06840 [Rhodobacterales bacterium 32-66-7]OZA10251.1 MAG: hypothetical protein B7Y02_11045 [Rhodobacterales bacterium 17-64-5]